MVVPQSSDQPLEISGVKVACANCGHLIVISVPRDLIFLSLDSTHKRTEVRFQVRPEYGDPRLCLPCRLQAVDSGRRSQLHSHYDEWLQEAALEGVPSGPIIWPVFMAFNDQGPNTAWRGWRIRTLAMQVSDLPKTLRDLQGLDVIWGATSDATPVELLVYQTALWNESIPGAGLVFHSGPHRSPPQLEIRNWRGIDRLSDLKKLTQGVVLYRQFRGERGRPRNTGRYESVSEFARVLHPIITELQREGTRPTLDRVADHLACNSRTLQKWIADYFSSHWIDVRNWPEGEWQRRMRS